MTKYLIILTIVANIYYISSAQTKQVEKTKTQQSKKSKSKSKPKQVQEQKLKKELKQELEKEKLKQEKEKLKQEKLKLKQDQEKEKQIKGDKILSIQEKIEKLQEKKKLEIKKEQIQVQKEDNEIYEKTKQLRYSRNQQKEYMKRMTQIYQLEKLGIQISKNLLKQKLKLMAGTIVRLALFRSLLQHKIKHQKQIVEQMNGGQLDVFLKRVVVGIQDQSQKNKPAEDVQFLDQLQKNVDSIIKISCSIEYADADD